MVAKPKGKKRLVLLDAHAIIHRAYHALPEFTTAAGEPTGGLYGLSAMLLKLAKDLDPDEIIACYDLPEPTYRHHAYEGYKATREKTDEALALQIDRSRDIFKAFAVPVYEKAGYEADDLLGTIVARLGKRADLDIVIASGDLDTLQLVRSPRRGASVRVYTLRKGIADTVLYDEKAVRERFGFPPDLLPDWKGLAGDASDNIVGVPGIGEKTATLLVAAFGSLEKIFATLRKSPGKLEAAGVKPRVVGLLKAHEEEARFSKELATIHRDVPVDVSLPEKPWRARLSLADLLALFGALEFRSLAARARELFAGKGEGPTGEREEAEEVDAAELKKVKVALWLLDSERTNPGLPEILAYAKAKSFAEAREKVLAELARHPKLRTIYETIELPLIPVVEAMERRGVLIDRPYLARLAKEYRAELAALEKKIWKLAGETFNINSPRQLADILFGKLGLAPKNHKRTGTGQKSTRESELEKLRDTHPVVPLLLEHREVQKLLSTYLDVILAATDADGRLHASFLQTGTTTGRMSSQNPNLQNIPIRSARGRAIRAAFIAPSGSRLVSFDYSQIELRIAAFLSGDRALTEIFTGGGDVHAAVASRVFGVPLGKVDYEMRRRAKVINFGILYGMGVNALRANLGTDRAEAERFLAAYFKTFAGLARYIDRVKREVARRGYTETYFGRRRFFPAIRSPLPYLRAAAERMAVNAPLQGTQADVIKLAMVRIDAELSRRGLRERAHLLLQVHDELVYELEEPVFREVAREAKRIMESVLPPSETGGIVFAVEAAAGKNWGEMEKLVL